MSTETIHQFADSLEKSYVTEADESTNVRIGVPLQEAVRIGAFLRAVVDKHELIYNDPKRGELEANDRVREIIGKISDAVETKDQIVGIDLNQSDITVIGLAKNHMTKSLKRRLGKGLDESVGKLIQSHVRWTNQRFHNR